METEDSSDEEDQAEIELLNNILIELRAQGNITLIRALASVPWPKRGSGAEPPAEKKTNKIQSLFFYFKKKVIQLMRFDQDLIADPKPALG